MTNVIAYKAEQAVREAGKLFLKNDSESRKIVEKGFANYVTEVDYAVQEFLIEELTKVIPGSNIISEEADENRYDLEKPTWILDPVDGTTNFMYGHRHSAISLALFTEGKPTMGIIYNPEADEMFIAQSGKGATLNGKDIKVSSNELLSNGLIAFGTTPYERAKADETFEAVKRVYKNCRDLRRAGSAALDIAYVACGRLDGYFELRIQPWDYAAGIIILQEAGGTITDWEGNSLEKLKPSSVVATNGSIHSQISELIV